MKKKFETPEVETKTQAELDAIISSIHNTTLPESTKAFVENCIRLACWFPSLLEKQHITMRKLREMIFGKGKKRKKSSDNDGENSSSDDGSSDNGNISSDKNNSGEDNSEDIDNPLETTATDDNKKATKRG